MKMRGLNGIRLYMGISYRARLGTISQVRARANTMIRANINAIVGWNVLFIESLSSQSRARL